MFETERFCSSLHCFQKMEENNTGANYAANSTISFGTVCSPAANKRLVKNTLSETILHMDPLQILTLYRLIWDWSLETWAPPPRSSLWKQMSYLPRRLPLTWAKIPHLYSVEHDNILTVGLLLYFVHIVNPCVCVCVFHRELGGETMLWEAIRRALSAQRERYCLSDRGLCHHAAGMWHAGGGETSTIAPHLSRLLSYDTQMYTCPREKWQFTQDLHLLSPCWWHVGWSFWKPWRTKRKTRTSLCVNHICNRLQNEFERFYLYPL